MHVVPTTWNIMAPAQPVEVFLIPRSSSKAASLQENFPEPLCVHFPLGVSGAFDGGGLYLKAPQHTPSLVFPVWGLSWLFDNETLWHCRFLLHLLQTCPDLGLSRC